MGLIVRLGGILEITKELGITRGCETKGMLEPIKFQPDGIICGGRKVNSRESLNNPKENGRGEIKNLFSKNGSECRTERRKKPNVRREASPFCESGRN